MDHDAWKTLPAAVRDEVDAKKSLVHAVHVLLRHGIPLQLAVDIVDKRRQTIAAMPPSLEALVAKLIGSEPQRIEATWQRETEGWRVRLDAVTKAHGRVLLHEFRGEQNDEWPQARTATELGAELARQLDVEFFFDSPDEPG